MDKIKYHYAAGLGVIVSKNPDPHLKHLGGYSYDPYERDWCAPPVKYLFKDTNVGTWDSEMIKILFTRPAKINEDITYPDLLPHQNYGVNFILARKRVLLCDEVGLGKTIQALTAINNIPGPALYITSNQLCPQVLQEALKWCPTKSPTIEKSFKQTAHNTLLILNYEQLLKLPDESKKLVWSTIVFDECHMISNTSTQRTKKAIKLAKQCEWLICMTATPIEKSTSQFWVYIHMIDPKKWKSEWRFINYFNSYTTLPNGRKIDFKPKNVEVLKWLVEPFYLRRESITYPTEYIVHEVDLYPQQRELYDIFNKADYVPLYDIEIPNELARQSYLRQIAVDPTFLAPYPSVKIEEAIKIISTIDPTDNITVFSEFTQPLLTLGLALNGREVVYEINVEDPYKDNKILALTYSKGAAGLNLQACHHVILLDMPYSHTRWVQMQGRFERMGQKDTVHYYIIQAKDTIDGKLDYGLAIKGKTFNRVVTKKE